MTLELSALLTTHNRAHLLPRVLAGLRRQTLERNRFEIIVVDDDSTDDTRQVLTLWQDRLPMRVVHQNSAGVAAAKNLGIFIARGPIIVFLDDGDVAEPDLLTAHLAAHIEYPANEIGVLGYTSLARDVRTPLMYHVTEIGYQLFSYGGKRAGQMLDHTAFWGGRSSCKRQFLTQSGVFHPHYGFGFEDIELAYRLAQHGFRVVFEPQAHTVMIRALNFDEFCNRSYQQGRSQYLFAATHDDPSVRLYCEIDAAFEAWRQWRLDYSAYIKWARNLDRLETARRDAGLGPHPRFQPVLDEAYRTAFFLSRAKGISDAASASVATFPVSAPTRACHRTVFQ